MITREEILNSTDGGLDIFRHLIPNLPAIVSGSKTTKHFIVPWRDEKHASTNLYKDTDGATWLFKDFGDGTTGNAIDYIMAMKGVGFTDAIKLAAEYANIPVPEGKKGKVVEEVILTPDVTLVNDTELFVTTNFHTFCLSIGISGKHLAKWHVGGKEKGKAIYTAFVYYKEGNEAVNIKYIAYGPDGKRNKEIKPWSLASIVKGEVYKLCLYGEHLLDNSKPVCIVESEKTAVIASFFYPQYNWLATGGVFGAKKLDYVRNGLADGRQNFVLQDADPVRKIPKAYEILLSIGARVDTVDLFPDRTDSTDIADYIIEGLRPEIIKDNVKVFWKKSEKRDEKLEIMPTRFGRFLEEHNFLKYYPDESNDFDFCSIEGKFVSITSTKRVKDYVLEYLKKPEFGEEAHDFFFLNTKFFKEDFLSGIATKSFDIKRDTKDECFLYYQNGVVRVTTEKTEVLPYSQIGGYIWKKHVLKRDFVLNIKEKSEYEKFIEFISGDEAKKDAFKSAIGYMIHEYRSPSKAKCVILNDENLESEPKGGAGKGIFCYALSQVRRVAKIDAKQFDSSDTFAYSGVDPTDQIVEFSDADKKLDFEKLFNVITDGFRIRRMYKDIIVLPPDKSPKIIITTNYAIKGRGGASRRRRYELEFTSHFNENWTVEEEFGHNLFSDWDKAEWARFDLFMSECVQFFLQKGLVKDIHKTLAAKTFEANTSSAFKDWCETETSFTQKLYPKRHFKADLLGAYHADNPTHKWMQKPTLMKWLEMYCEYANLEIKEGNTNGRWVEFHPMANYVAPKKDSDDDEDESEGINYNEPPF